ncbi:hypothetical protein [Sphingomonas sp. Leaf339]|uniref:hypothetical protein n=1 Tax=Sphingomonas sp. Leaf339 TaxID=1736343 RepID=UPI0012E33654|nr:hypothetical protein [Sphingomonas sp. Leaf339]
MEDAVYGLGAALTGSLLTWLVQHWYAGRAKILEIDDPILLGYIEGGLREAVQTAEEGDAIHIIEIWNKGRKALVDLSFDIIEPDNRGGISNAGFVFHSGSAPKPRIQLVEGRIQIKHNCIQPVEPLRMWVISKSRAPLQLHCASDAIRVRSRRPRRTIRIPLIN